MWLLLDYFLKLLIFYLYIQLHILHQKLNKYIFFHYFLMLFHYIVLKYFYLHYQHLVAHDYHFFLFPNLFFYYLKVQYLFLLFFHYIAVIAKTNKTIVIKIEISTIFGFFIFFSCIINLHYFYC